MSDDIIVIKSSGNVFVDFGFDMFEEECFKVQFVCGICDIFKGCWLMQVKVVELFGFKQFDVFVFINGQMVKFFIDWLLCCICGFDCEVIFVIKLVKCVKCGIGVVQVVV